MTHTLTGTVRFHRGVPSRLLDGGRDVILYLPPGYNESTAHYPVLYLHDGQNLFDAATAFCNQEWGLDELAESLIRENLINPLILVGIYNAEENRLAEYTHVRNRRGNGGQARRYARFIVDELKPFIDSEYRTLPQVEHTGLGGSSLGGLVTLYMGLHFPSVFSKLIAMSPSIWWANRAILREVRIARPRPAQTIWLDIGTSEGSDPEAAIRNARDLRDALLVRGWRLDHDLRYLEDAGAEHHELAWGQRMRDALTFLYPHTGTSSSPLPLG